MSRKSLNVERAGPVLRSDPTRVLLRPFNSAVDSERNGTRDIVVGKSYMTSSTDRAVKISSRVLALPEQQVGPLLDHVMNGFAGRHRELGPFFRTRFEQIRHLIPDHQELSESRKMLLGSYFTSEYSLEAAALFNPSIVPHPAQSHLPPGSMRFILSLRATGEGHISSITFRVGTLDRNAGIKMDQPTRFISEPQRIVSSVHEKQSLERKLVESGHAETVVRQVTRELTDRFTLAELRALLDNIASRTTSAGHEQEQVARGLWMLAISNYEVRFRPDQGISERVLFPGSPSQSNGIEDARFVLFQDDDASAMYYATFTAYDGHTISPQLLETRDFLGFRFSTLSGSAVSNKGMALFPRKINGRYVMLSRQDNQNILVMSSDNITSWHDARIVLAPTYPWEFVQLGNCGSPIETAEGWLVLTHGVGAMRTYCIGAFLLDKTDPLKVLGRLREPLLHADEKEREGYVPNVVYTCGAMVHGETLVLPYAMSDSASSFATVSLSEVLGAME
jgi:predicted GH43/DUF377 family glycosyl hydrolase